MSETYPSDEALQSDNRHDLAEAIERWPVASIDEINGDLGDLIYATARRVLEGEQWKVCETHKASSDDDATPEGATVCWKALKGVGHPTDCSIVTVRIVREGVGE